MVILVVKLSLFGIMSVNTNINTNYPNCGTVKMKFPIIDGAKSWLQNRRQQSIGIWQINAQFRRPI